jgi:hypothetical protein
VISIEAFTVVLPDRYCIYNISMKVCNMAMSKKDMDKKKIAKKEKMQELEKLASTGSKDAKKKLEKEKKKK